MKMRSIALVAAVVIGTVGLVSAEVARPTEAALAGAPAAVTIPSRPISTPPATTTTSGMMPGMATMPMVPGVQRMPPTGTMPYGPGYQTMTPEQAAKLGAMQAGMEITRDLATTGAKIGEGYATTDAELKKARGLAEIEQQKLERIRAQQEAHDQAIADKITKATQPSIDSAQAANATARSQIKDLQKKMNDASDLGIDTSNYNDDLKEAKDSLAAAKKDMVAADGVLAKCLSELDLKQIQLVNRAYANAKDSAEIVDLSSAIDALNAKIRNVKAQTARTGTARRTSYSR
ncbi:MAG: hypothetical protein WC365_04735 [Candidatus Babeliales bacterium]|jgi:hypothetical protein